MLIHRDRRKGEQMKGVKKAGVCKGCKYYIEKSTTISVRGICGYMDATGSSRLKVELESGGYKSDSCVCYEKKQGRRKKSI